MGRCWCVCVCVCLFQCNYRKNVKGHSLAFIVTSEFCSFWEVSSEPNEPHVFSLQAICAVCVTTSFLRCGIKFSRRDPSYWKYSFTVHLSPCLRSHLTPQHFCAGTGVLDALSLISLKPPSREQQGAGFRSVRAYVVARAQMLTEVMPGNVLDVSRRTVPLCGSRLKHRITLSSRGERGRRWASCH